MRALDIFVHLHAKFGYGCNLLFFNTIHVICENVSNFCAPERCVLQFCLVLVG